MEILQLHQLEMLAYSW